MVPFLFLIPFIKYPPLAMSIAIMAMIGIWHHSNPHNIILTALDVIAILTLLIIVALYTQLHISPIIVIAVAILIIAFVIIFKYGHYAKLITPYHFAMISNILGFATLCLLYPRLSRLTIVLVAIYAILYLVTYILKHCWNCVHVTWSVVHVLGLFILVSALRDLELLALHRVA